jgi:hypothetical protein
MRTNERMKALKIMQTDREACNECDRHHPLSLQMNKQSDRIVNLDCQDSSSQTIHFRSLNSGGLIFKYWNNHLDNWNSIDRSLVPSILRSGEQGWKNRTMVVIRLLPASTINQSSNQSSGKQSV